MLNSLVVRDENITEKDNLEFTAANIIELEKCIQLTPKFTEIYALSHIETLF